MRLLNREDFKGFNFKTDQSGIDMLADICGVALDVLEQEKRRRLKGKENEIVHGLKLRIPKSTITSIATASSHKRSRNEEESDDDDDDGDDWDIFEVKNSKKSRKRRRSRPSNFIRRTAPAADPAELPGEFRREIEEMAGRDIKLGNQKQLTETDLKPHHNRLLIPFTQIIDGDFLTEAEKSKLRRKEVIEDVPLLIKEPTEERMEVMNINLTQWDMAKQSGMISSSNYVLRTSWQKVALRNRLQKDDVVQVWSFRVQDRLRLALVVVARANHQLPLIAINTASTSTSGAGSSSTGNNGSTSSGSRGNTQIVEASTPP